MVDYVNALNFLRFRIPKSNLQNPILSNIKFEIK